MSFQYNELIFKCIQRRQRLEFKYFNSAAGQMNSTKNSINAINVILLIFSYTINVHLTP